MLPVASSTKITVMTWCDTVPRRIWSRMESAQCVYLRTVWSGVVLWQVLLYPIFAGRFPIFASLCRIPRPLTLDT